MTLENQLFRIDINIDDAFSVEDGSSQGYDYCYNPHAYNDPDYSKVFSIHVYQQNRQYKIALIGNINSYDDHCAVLEGNLLTVLQGWDVLQFNVESAELLKVCRIDSWTCNYAIYRVKDGYVIHGETDITMLDERLQKMWSFSGYDIFESVTGKKPFEIKEDRICLYDFCDNYYEIDFNGNVILSTV